MGRLIYWLFGAYFVLGPFFFPNAPFLASLPSFISVLIGLIGWVAIRNVVRAISFIGTAWEVQTALFKSAMWLTPFELYKRLEAKRDIAVIMRVLYSLERQELAVSRPRSTSCDKLGPWEKPDQATCIEWKIHSGGPRRRRIILLKPSKTSIDLPEGVLPA